MYQCTLTATQYLMHIFPKLAACSMLQNLVSVLKSNQLNNFPRRKQTQNRCIDRSSHNCCIRKSVGQDKN